LDIDANGRANGANHLIRNFVPPLFTCQVTSRFICHPIPIPCVTVDDTKIHLFLFVIFSRSFLEFVLPARCSCFHDVQLNYAHTPPVVQINFVLYRIRYFLIMKPIRK